MKVELLIRRVCMFYMWLIIVIILGFIEAITVDLVTIWFIISGVIAMLLSFITDSILIQFSSFVILGILFMILTKPFIKKVKNNEKTNIDRIIGMKGKVTETIEKNGIGEVKVDGKLWSAYSDSEIKVGSTVKVLSINSVKLKVEEWKE